MNFMLCSFSSRWLLEKDIHSGESPMTIDGVSFPLGVRNQMLRTAMFLSLDGSDVGETKHDIGWLKSAGRKCRQIF